MSDSREVIVVGGGMAGLTAVLAAAVVGFAVLGLRERALGGRLDGAQRRPDPVDGDLPARS